MQAKLLYIPQFGINVFYPELGYSYEPLLAFYQVITLSTISCCSRLLLRR